MLLQQIPSRCSQKLNKKGVSLIAGADSFFMPISLRIQENCEAAQFSKRLVPQVFFLMSREYAFLLDKVSDE
jgi:hypothetical protein